MLCGQVFGGCWCPQGLKIKRREEERRSISCVFLSQPRTLFWVYTELLMDYFGDLGIQNAASLV